MPQTPSDTAEPALTRDPDRLASTRFDLAVVGGGIYGVWAALDAAQRGLSVALLEQNDFGSGASANSQRVVHGGLRYLQHGDLKRMRESIRERSTLLRAAGHLVRPMPFLVPTYGLGLRGRPAMFTAMKLNDAISADRNRGLPVSRRLPNGKMISSAECLEIAPGIQREGLTGGAVFYDAQVNNSERLALAVVCSAVAAGAQVANHMRVTGLVREGGRVTGVRAEDRLTGKALDVTAKVTLCCAGPWTGRTASMLSPDAPDGPRRYEVLRAVALVTRDLFHGQGLAVPSRKVFKDNKELIGKGYRNLFVTSWQGRSLVGTFYSEYQGDPDNLSVSAEEIRAFVDEFNQAYPAAGLRYRDVCFTFMGLLPKAAGTSGGEPICEKRYRLIDHAKANGVEGLVTVFGVKWTTARSVAQQAVTLAAGKLGRSAPPCRTAETLIYGAPACDPAQGAASALGNRPDWASEALAAHLFEAYGTRHTRVLALADADPPLREPVSDNGPTILAQIVYAVREEMARSLLDLLFQRTDAGFFGYPGDRALARCADLLARELAWDDDRTQQEIESVRLAYRQRGLDLPDSPAALTHHGCRKGPLTA
jgi:glycerol-3-phosphate dehydrogenase